MKPELRSILYGDMFAPKGQDGEDGGGRANRLSSQKGLRRRKCEGGDVGERIKREAFEYSERWINLSVGKRSKELCWRRWSGRR